MKYSKIFLSVLLIMIGSKLLASDGFTISPFLYDYELSTTHIKALTQDREGKIWVAGIECIYSFDGYKVEKIVVPRHKAVTSQHVIHNIYVDAQNRIWLAFETGICCYDPQVNSFTYHFPYPGEMLNMANVVYDILEDANNVLYFATRNGIFQMLPNSDKLVRFQNFPWHEICSGYKCEERIASCMHIDRNGALWVGTEGDGVMRINLQDGSRISFKHIPNDPSTLCNNTILSIFEDQYGVMWFGTLNGLAMFRKESATFSSSWNEFTSREINSITNDEYGNILVGTNQGLAIIKRKENTVEWLKRQTNPNNQASAEIISTTFRDRSGKIWLGTANGLMNLDEPKDFMLLQRETDKEKLSLSSNFLRTLAVKDNQLWISSTSGQIDRYDPVKKSLKNYAMASLYAINKEYNTIVSAYLTRKNELLIGTSGGLLKYNPSKDQFEPFSFLSSGKPQKSVYPIIEDQHNDFWLGILDEGLFRYRLGQDSLEKIPISYENIYKNIYTNIKILHEDRDGYIWIVFWRAGILRYNPITREEKLFTQENTNGKLLNNTVWAVKEDSQGRLWLATAGGLCLLDSDKETFIQQKSLSALAGISIIGILENPKDGTLWLPSTDGLFKFDPKSGNIIHFSEMDGLQGGVFTHNVYARIDSFLFFGGNNGLNIINSHKTFSNSYIPELHLTKIVVNERTIYPSANASVKTPFTMEIKQNDQVEVFFSGFSFRKEWRNNYRYRIVGADSTLNWIINPRINSVKLPPLKKGHYTFEVMASNCDGNWSPVIPLVNFKVSHTWTLYSIILIILIILAGSIFAYRKSYRKIKFRIQKYQHKKRQEHTEHKLIDSHTQYLLEKLTKLMVEDQVFRNKRLTKSDLSGSLKITELQLSQLLHTHYNKSFPDFINTYRVEAVKSRLENTKSLDYKILAIGDECGFNSKSSFYRVFKEYTGVTPVEYLEQLPKY